MIRVALADDHAMVRQGVRMMLETDSSIEVVGEASDGMQAVSLVKSAHPDIILLDISMGAGENGLVACKDIVRDFPQTKVIMLTMFNEPAYLRFSLADGASGFLLKTASQSELLEAIHQVAQGNIYVQDSISASLPETGESEPAAFDADVHRLTARELEVLLLLAKGYTNKEIAEQAFLSVKTVEAHRAHIYAKLGFKSRADLVSFAIHQKLLAL